MQIEIFKKCKGPESLPLSNENNPEGTLKLIPGEIIKSLNRKLKKLKSDGDEKKRLFKAKLFNEVLFTF